MKLFERYGDPDFHTCVVTTFGVDFEAYEHLALTRLRGAGCYNNLLIGDANMLPYALEGASLPPQWAGRQYSVVGASAKGVFHPKLTLQLGRQKGRLMISSANMTASGLAGNLELVGQVSCDTTNTGETRLIAAAWRYLSGLLDTNPQAAVAHQMHWLRARSSWLFQTTPADGPEVLADGSRAAFLVSDPTANGIGWRFAELVDDAPVERLVVLSPYWDDDLGALRALAAQLGTAEIMILIDSRRALFPGEALAELPEAELYDLAGLSKGRFIHAKAILVQTRTSDHLLFGSANCTWSALGNAQESGINQEVCLYRQLPANSALAHLGLESILEQAPLSADVLPTKREEDPLPLASAGSRFPGTFEYTQGTLQWTPPTACPEETAIELLDLAYEPLDASVVLAGPKDARPQRYQVLQGIQSPAFARLRYADGGTSALAIVTQLDVLREHVRDRRSRQAESYAQLLGEETEEGLWLLEVLDNLEAAGSQARPAEPGASPHRKPTRQRPEEGHYQYSTLEYSQFIAGRQSPEEKHGPATSSLAGSDLSLVRGFLNRLLGMDVPSALTDDADHDTAVSFALGDETHDAAEALEQGEEFTDLTSTDAELKQPEPNDERERLAQMRAGRKQLSEAAKSFIDRYMKARRPREAPLTVVDVLRLRALLIVLTASGQPSDGDKPSTALQVLPHKGQDDSWPMLIGRVLYSFFGGNQPPVERFHIEKTDGAIPVDILECWGTCLWATHACLEALSAEKSSPRSLSVLCRLASKIYGLMGVSQDEVFSGPLRDAFERTNNRFAGRLGLSRAAIHHSHEEAYAKRHQGLA